LRCVGRRAERFGLSLGGLHGASRTRERERNQTQAYDEGDTHYMPLYGLRFTPNMAGAREAQEGETA
jgi:hypothetical protein